jgi:hypothetical protein
MVSACSRNKGNNAHEPAGDPMPKPQQRPGNSPQAEAAKRALAEAEARRAAIDEKTAKRPREIAGRDGPDPARYGDWEKKGIASDF